MYKTVNGSYVSKRAVNRHHVMFESGRYADSYGKAFRNLNGFVLPMLVEVHNDLHANVYQPIKPCKLLMVDIIQAERELPRDISTYERFKALSERFYHLSATSANSRISNESGRIYDNLMQQDHFISMGVVAPVPELETL